MRSERRARLGVDDPDLDARQRGAAGLGLVLLARLPLVAGDRPRALGHPEVAAHVNRRPERVLDQPQRVRRGDVQEPADRATDPATRNRGAGSAPSRSAGRPSRARSRAPARSARARAPGSKWSIEMSVAPMLKREHQRAEAGHVEHRQRVPDAVLGRDAELPCGAAPGPHDGLVREQAALRVGGRARREEDQRDVAHSKYNKIPALSRDFFIGV